MDDTPANQTPGEEFNKLDLTALEAFQFGTQWTDAGKKPAGGSSHGHAREGDGGAPRRDRRPPRRPSEGGSAPYASGGAGSAPRGDMGGQRPPPRFGPNTGDRRGPFNREGGPSSSGPGGQGGQGGPGGDRFDRRPRFDRSAGGDARDQGPRRPSGPPRPYISPIFEVTFYPDDTGFNALVKAMRSSCRTYELFEIARLILGKVERCVLVFKRRPETPGGSSGPIYVSVPDGVPFPTEEEAINHAFERSMDQFFTTEQVEVEPPKGTFQFVNRCPITKDLLGPPNYHRYAQTVQHHYNARGLRMPFEKYKAAVEVVRDPEAVNQWLESMKKVTRYTLRAPAEGESVVFDNIEDARAHLLRVGRDRIVRAVESARVSAKAVEAAGRTEAGEALQGALEGQRRFPLDTANALRGRLRRENFHIFKRGSKGVTYVCAVRRKFRQPGQTFSDSINALIGFLDAHPLANVRDLPLKFLGFAPPVSQPAAVPAAPAPAAAAEGAVEPAAEATPAAPAAAPEPALTNEQKNLLNRLILDLRWLVSEGYVAEYSDGRLFAHPVLAQGQTEPDEKDHDPVAAEARPAADEAPGGAETPASTETAQAATEGTPVMEEAPATEETSSLPSVEAPTEPAEAPEAVAEVSAASEETPAATAEAAPAGVEGSAASSEASDASVEQSEASGEEPKASPDASAEPPFSPKP